MKPLNEISRKQVAALWAMAPGLHDMVWEVNLVTSQLGAWFRCYFIRAVDFFFYIKITIKKKTKTSF